MLDSIKTFFLKLNMTDTLSLYTLHAGPADAMYIFAKILLNCELLTFSEIQQIIIPKKHNKCFTVMQMCLLPAVI